MVVVHHSEKDGVGEVKGEVYLPPPTPSMVSSPRYMYCAVRHGTSGLELCIDRVHISTGKPQVASWSSVSMGKSTVRK